MQAWLSGAADGQGGGQAFGPGHAGGQDWLGGTGSAVAPPGDASGAGQGCGHDASRSQGGGQGRAGWPGPAGWGHGGGGQGRSAAGDAVVGAFGWAQGGGHARTELAEPVVEQGGGHFVGAWPEPDGWHGGGHAGAPLTALAFGQGRGQAAGSQGGWQGRLGEAPDAFGHGVAVATRSSAAVVVVEADVVGGDCGAVAASAAGAEPAASPAGSEADGPADIVATDRAGREPGAAWDTATSASTMATVLRATRSTRGDSRRIQRRCTVVTSPPPDRGRGRPSCARPQPVRLVI